MTYFDWFAPWRTAAMLARTGVALAEVGLASPEVIARRLHGIAKMRIGGRSDPELARLVPEKVDALSLAGRSLAGDLIRLQWEMAGWWGQAATAAAQGRAFEAAGAAAAYATMLRLADDTLAAPGRALKPIHARVTSNVRRLRRTGQR